MSTKDLDFAKSLQDEDDDADNNVGAIKNKKKTAANSNDASQQYYDTETGGAGGAFGDGDDKIVAVETDQDYAKKNKPRSAAAAGTTTSRSRSPAVPKIDWSACCNTKKKQWAWCAMFTVVLIVGIALLAASLKKLNSTEVRTIPALSQPARVYGMPSICVFPHSHIFPVFDLPRFASPL
jgi:hypothetical protein